MAGRNAAPGPAEPKVTKSRRSQRKPENGPETTVNYKKTEKDVDKLIHCLAEWTEDMRAARSVVPEAPLPKRHSPVQRPEGYPHGVSRAVLSAGESPYPIDGIQGSRRIGLVGIRGGGSRDATAAAGTRHHSTGTPPPLRLGDRVAIHVRGAGGLAVPGGNPTPIPLGRSPIRPALGPDQPLAGASRLVSTDRVARSGGSIGS